MFMHSLCSSDTDSVPKIPVQAGYWELQGTWLGEGRKVVNERCNIILEKLWGKCVKQMHQNYPSQGEGRGSSGIY